MPTMPKITLYVRDDDGSTWTRARKVATATGESLSTFVTAALSDAIARRDELTKREAQQQAATADEPWSPWHDVKRPPTVQADQRWFSQRLPQLTARQRHALRMVIASLLPAERA